MKSAIKNIWVENWAYLALFIISIGIFFIIRENFGLLFAISIFFLIAGLFFLFSIKNPFYIVLFLPIGSYLGYLVQFFKDAPIPLSLFQIFLFLAFAIFLLNRVATGNFIFKTTGLEFEWLVFFLLIYFSLIYSPNRGDGLFYATRFLILILMIYLILNSIETKSQVLMVIYAILVISFILGLISIKEGLLNTEAAIINFFTAGQRMLGRATVVQRDPNIFATHFFLPVLFTASLIITPKIRISKKLIYGILFTIYFAGIISTFSRSAWIAVIFALFILAFLNKQYKLLFLLLIAGFLAILFVPNFKILFINIVNRFFGIFTGNLDDSSRVRIYLFLGAMEMFFGSYLFGVGFRGFPVVFPRVISTQKTFGIVEPHNILYTILAELGIIGFLIFLWIIWRIGRISYLNFKISPDVITRAISGSLFVSFIAYLIFYQFYVDFLVDNNFWILVALIFCLNFVLNHKIKIPQELND